MAKSKTSDPIQVKITDEIRDKLHGFALVSNSIVIPYKVELEGVPDELLPTFKVKTLSVSKKEELKSKQFSSDNEIYFAELIRSHIVGWSNLYDLSTDTIIDFISDEDEGCSKDLFEMLPNQIKINILTYISQMSGK